MITHNQAWHGGHCRIHHVIPLHDLVHFLCHGLIRVLSLQGTCLASSELFRVHLLGDVPALGEESIIRLLLLVNSINVDRSTPKLNLLPRFPIAVGCILVAVVLVHVT